MAISYTIRSIVFLSVAVYALLPAGTFLDLALLFEVGSWNLFKK